MTKEKRKAAPTTSRGKSKGRGIGKGRKHVPPMQGGKDTEAEATDAPQPKSLVPV